MSSSWVDGAHDSIKQHEERLHEKVAARFGEQPSSGNKLQSYSDPSITPPVAVPVSGV